MTAYRRNFVQGGCFFFTVNLAEPKLALLMDHVELLRGALRETRQRHPFAIDAIMVLPDHLHTVWTLREGDADFAMRWQLIRSTFSRGTRPIGPAISRMTAAITVNGDREAMGFARAQPILRAYTRVMDSF